MIVTHIPYCPSEVDDGYDLGWTYNELMSRLRPGDWGVFLDHDAMFTTPYWHRQIEKAIANTSDADAFTCLTNRIGCPWQRPPGISQTDHDVRYHRAVGQRLYDEGYSPFDVTDNQLMSGVLIVLSKDAWERGAKFESGFYGVDNSLHLAVRKMGGKVYLLRDVYVYHWYRADGQTSLPPDIKRRTAPSFR